MSACGRPSFRSAVRHGRPCRLRGRLPGRRLPLGLCQRQAHHRGGSPTQGASVKAPGEERTTPVPARSCRYRVLPGTRRAGRSLSFESRAGLADLGETQLARPLRYQRPPFGAHSGRPSGGQPPSDSTWCRCDRRRATMGHSSHRAGSATKAASVPAPRDQPDLRLGEVGHDPDVPSTVHRQHHRGLTALHPIRGQAGRWDGKGDGVACAGPCRQVEVDGCRPFTAAIPPPVPSTIRPSPRMAP